MEEDGTFEVLPKKEVALLNKQRARLEKFLGGIEDMPRIPDVMYVVDPHKEQIAVKEEAERSGQYYINHRWLGGTLTNWGNYPKTYCSFERNQTYGRRRNLRRSS